MLSKPSITWTSKKVFIVLETKRVKKLFFLDFIINYYYYTVKSTMIIKIGVKYKIHLVGIFSFKISESNFTIFLGVHRI